MFALQLGLYFGIAKNPDESTEMHLIVEGQDDVGNKKVFASLLPIGKAGEGKTRIEVLGLKLLIDGDKVGILNAVFDSISQKAGLDFDQVIEKVLVPASQPTKRLMYIPALILCVLIALLQCHRERVAVAAKLPRARAYEMHKDILLAVELTHNESWKKSVPTVIEYAMAFGSTLQVVTFVFDFDMSIVAAYFPKDHDEKAMVDAGGMQGGASRLHQGAHSRQHQDAAQHRLR